jgi:hypothetical protein
MERPIHRAILASMVMLVVVFLLLEGVTRKHRIHDPADEEFGIATFQRINEFQLALDATFSGVARRGAKLYTTYDRTMPGTKRRCPT